MSNSLWFLLFLLIPFIVHLFNFRRAKKIFFTNVRFIQDASAETKSKTRLKHLLVLASRTLAFLCVIGSFLFFLSSEKWDFADSDSSYFIYYDNSVSNYSTGPSSTRSTTVDYLNSLDIKSAQLLTNDFSPFSNRPRSKSQILDRLSDVPVSYVNRTLTNVLDRVDEATGNITLISDFQSAALEEFEAMKIDTSKTFQLIVRDNELKANVYVDTVWTSRNIEDYSQDILTCVLASSGDLSSNIVVKLLTDDGNLISSVAMDFANSKRITFSIPRTTSGKKYKIQISGDELNYDNEFYITSSRGMLPSILLLNQVSNSYLSNVFKNDDLFDLTVLDANQIDYELIKEMNLVILNEYYQLPEGLIEQNASDVSFVVIPSDSIKTDSYLREMPFNLSVSNNKELSELEMNNNLFLDGVFANFGGGVSMPQAVSRYDVLGAGERILMLRDRKAFLTKSIGKQLFFFSSPLTDEYTDFPTHSVFLPVMYRIAESSLGPDKNLFVYPSDYVELPGFSSENPIKIVADGIEIVPEFSFNNNSTTIKIPTAIPPGFYHFVQVDDTIQTIGVNLPKSESLKGNFSIQDIEAFFSDSDHVTVVEGDPSSIEALYAKASQNSLWKYALALALVFFMIETMLHKYLK